MLAKFILVAILFSPTGEQYQDNVTTFPDARACQAAKADMTKGLVATGMRFSISCLPVLGGPKA